MTGLLDKSAKAYHDDDIDPDRPSLSKSVMFELITRSPAHAKAAHPRLNPDFQRVEEERFAVGTCAHALLLEGEAGVYVVQENDWRTKAAKEAREYAREMGKIPLLGKHWDEVQAMVAVTRRELERIDVSPGLFVDGKPEQTVVWEEDGVLCRARLDWLHDNHSTIDDYKTTSASAAPEKWSRTMFGIGGDIQAAFYLRGMKATIGIAPDWRYVVQETKPPYALTVFALAPDVIALADRKVQFAIDTWRTCLETDTWPSYPTEVCWVTAPPWEETQFFDREARAA